MANHRGVKLCEEKGRDQTANVKMSQTVRVVKVLHFTHNHALSVLCGLFVNTYLPLLQLRFSLWPRELDKPP